MAVEEIKIEKKDEQWEKIVDFSEGEKADVVVEKIEEAEKGAKSPCGKGKKHKKVDTPGCTCGRPPKYTTDEDMIAKVDEYLDTCVDDYDPETKQRIVRLPKLESFALMLGISMETLNVWGKKYPKFSDALDKIRLTQKEKLIDEGLAGSYNPVIAKLNLASNHGMADKVDQDLTSKGEKLQGVAVSFVDNGDK